MTAIRACEVVADPTNALTLEAAVRRSGAALVSAGRDEGSGRFERAALAERLRFAVAGLRAAACRGFR